MVYYAIVKDLRKFSVYCSLTLYFSNSNETTSHRDTLIRYKQQTTDDSNNTSTAKAVNTLNCQRITHSWIQQRKSNC